MATRQVIFKFNIDQVVMTPIAGKGMIKMLAVDDGGITYYVQTANSSNWISEHLLVKTNLRDTE